MTATEVKRPFHRPGWVYEENVDGWRVLAYKDAGDVRLVSRNGRDLTRRFQSWPPRWPRSSRPHSCSTARSRSSTASSSPTSNDCAPPKGRRRDPATSHGPGTLGRLANVIGIVAALVALGLIGYFASLGIQLWRPGGG